MATGVSAHRELFEAARAAGAQLILAHHGLLWDFSPRAINPRMADKLRILLTADIGLAMYHLPLDAHPEHGNNALLAQALGCEERRPFGVYRGREIGVAGRFPGDGVPAHRALRARARGHRRARAAGLRRRPGHGAQHRGHLGRRRG